MLFLSFPVMPLSSLYDQSLTWLTIWKFFTDNQYEANWVPELSPRELKVLPLSHSSINVLTIITFAFSCIFSFIVVSFTSLAACVLKRLQFAAETIFLLISRAVGQAAQGILIAFPNSWLKNENEHHRSAALIIPRIVCLWALDYCLSTVNLDTVKKLIDKRRGLWFLL